MADPAKVRREFMRWQILLALNNARDVDGTGETLLLAIVQAEFPDASALELRRELDYLAERDLIRLTKRPDGRWLADINRYGIDVVEYTVDVDPGIARPQKYWG